MLPFQVPIHFDNASRYCGYYELQEEPQRSHQTFATILSSENSISGSLIEQGTIRHGSNYLIGEYGHIITDYTFSQKCKCGNYGCIETIVKESSVADRIQAAYDKIKDQNMIPVNEEQITLNNIFQKADEGNSFAMDLLDPVIQQFAMLIYNMQLTFDPDEIIFQGFYGCAGSYFKTTLESLVLKTLSHRLQSIKITYNSKNFIELAFAGAHRYCLDRFIDTFTQF